MDVTKDSFIGMLKYLGHLTFSLVVFLPFSSSAQNKSSSPRIPLPKDISKCVNSFSENYSYSRGPSLRNKFHEVNFPKKVFSLEEMDVSKIKDLDDLKKYGILNPNETNHKAGSNIIIMTLNATGPWKREWTKAYGLLGVSMLNANLRDRNAYRSLFTHSPYRYKMHASSLGHRSNITFLRKRGSLMGRREYHIFRISSEFNWIYEENNDTGRMKIRFFDGLEFYHSLKKKGYDDKILKTILGIARAHLSLKNEFSYEEFIRIRGLDPPTIYLDALKAAINKPSSGKGVTFLESLSVEMSKRGMRTTDQILYPNFLDKKEMKELLVMINLIKEDLKAIECKN